MENLQEIKMFWEMYDQYIISKDEALMPKLSRFLVNIEKQSKKEQLLRPEKGWNKILAWIVLRNQDFIFSEKNIFSLMKGEVLAWCPEWDRDLFVTRTPFFEFISDKILRPGVDFSTNEYQYDEFLKTKTEQDFRQFLLYTGQANQKGLYLPIFGKDTLLDFVNYNFEKSKENALLQLEKNFII